MRRAAMCALLLACAVAPAGATPQGFTTSLEQARAEAAQTGKSIFVYFNLNG